MKMHIILLLLLNNINEPPSLKTIKDKDPR